MYAIRSYYGGAIWFPEVIGRDALVNAALLLTGTEKIVLATGIANIYARDAMAMSVITSYSIHYTKLYELSYGWTIDAVKKDT